MHKIMNIKKILIFQIIIIMVFTMILNIFTSKVIGYTVTHNQTKQTGIDSFPESYKEALKKLQETHPNWTFTAYNTGMTWNEFMTGETNTHLRNRVHNSSEASWKCTCSQSSRRICLCIIWCNCIFCRSKKLFNRRSEYSSSWK